MTKYLKRTQSKFNSLAHLLSCILTAVYPILLALLAPNYAAAIDFNAECSNPLMVDPKSSFRQFLRSSEFVRALKNSHLGRAEVSILEVEKMPWVEALAVKIHAQVSAIENSMLASEDVEYIAHASGSISIVFLRSKQVWELALHDFHERQAENPYGDTYTQYVPSPFQNLQRMMPVIEERVGKLKVNLSGPFKVNPRINSLFEPAANHEILEHLQNLSSNKLAMVHAFGRSAYKAVFKTLPAILLVNAKGMNLKAADYRGDLHRFFKSHKIDPVLQGRFTLRRGQEIEMNMAGLTYESLPMPAKNAILSLVNDRIRFYLELRELPDHEEELRNHIIATTGWKHLTYLDLALMPLQTVHGILVETFTNIMIYATFHESPESLRKVKVMLRHLEQRLNEEHKQVFEIPHAQYLRSLAQEEVPESYPDWFILEGIRIPIKPLGQLSEAARGMVNLKDRVERAQAGRDPVDLSKTQQAVRALLISEYEQISAGGLYRAKAETQFEPYIGPQVSEWRRKPRYSGSILTTQVPAYLIRRHWEYSGYKPTLEAIYDFQVSDFKLND